MPIAGDSATAQLTVNPYDLTTAATLQLISPAGVATPVATTSGDGGATWLAQVTYATAGVWQLAWTVTGTGAGHQTERVVVGTATVPTGWRTYATSTDLVGYLDGDDIPDNADRLLRDASVMIDRLLLSATYDVDDQDLPTDPVIAAAMRDAVCEQVNWWLKTGDPDGARGAFQSLSIGGITIAAAAAAGRTGPRSNTRIGPQVISILENAGLMGQPPVTW